VAQHAPPDCEVVVVDDGSAAAEASRIACGFAGVRVVRLPRARGFARAATPASAPAAATSVELLNDDTEVQPGWADAALRPFADPLVAAARRWC